MGKIVRYIRLTHIVFVTLPQSVFWIFVELININQTAPHKVVQNVLTITGDLKLKCLSKVANKASDTQPIKKIKSAELNCCSARLFKLPRKTTQTAPIPPRNKPTNEEKLIFCLCKPQANTAVIPGTKVKITAVFIELVVSNALKLHQK